MQDVLGLESTVDKLSTEGVRVQIEIKNTDYLKILGVVIVGVLGYFLIRGALKTD